MAVEIKVPSVGESISEGTIARWLKKNGDAVRADEPVFELETEKATSEIPAPAAGTLHITVPEGKTVAIGSVVGRIEEGAPAARATSTKEKREEAAKAAPEKKQPAAMSNDKHGEEASEAVLSPSARQLASEKGVDVGQLTGTGRGGRITKEDVLSFLDQRKAAPTEKPPEPSPAPKASAPAP